jgi:hypothetical protein
MIGLNLSERKSQLPASAFPERADIYICDQCQRDLTEHFIPGQAHVMQPLGPERYTCECGRRYLTGAVEWQNLSEWDRRRRKVDAFGIGALFSVMLSIPGLCVYFVLRLLHLPKVALFVAVFIAACPLVLSVTMFLSEVLASLWRTRHK